MKYLSLLITFYCFFSYSQNFDKRINDLIQKNINDIKIYNISDDKNEIQNYRIIKD